MANIFAEWLSTIIFAYVVGVVVIGLVISIMTTIREYLRWEESSTTARTCIQNIIVKVPQSFLVATLWPFLIVYTLYWWMPRRVCLTFWGRHRLRPYGEEAIDVRQRVQIWTPGKWQHRGWIVMMRARHRRSLLRATKSWLPWSNFRRSKPRLKSTASAAVSSTFERASVPQAAEAGTPTIPEIELAEAGRSDRRFAQVVTAVVEIDEEGLFRSIITYI